MIPFLKKMGDYEREQMRLQKLLQEMLSDEEQSLFGGNNSSDDYHTESEDSGGSSGASFEKRKKVRRNGASNQGMFPSTRSIIICLLSMYFASHT